MLHNRPAQVNKLISRIGLFRLDMFKFIKKISKNIKKHHYHRYYKMSDYLNSSDTSEFLPKHESTALSEKSINDYFKQ